MPSEPAKQLSDIASPFLHFLTTFAGSNESIEMSERWLREEILDHLAAFEHEAKEANYSDILEPATRLLVYTADDIVTHAPGGVGDSWDHLQAAKFSGKVLGGSSFYELFDSPGLVKDETIRQLAPLCQRSEIKEAGFPLSLGGIPWEVTTGFRRQRGHGPI